MIARGAGRSYGDAAQNDGGDVIDMTGLDRIVSIDGERGLITAQAGATVAQLMVRLAAHGLTLPVVPGTRHVTLGGRDRERHSRQEPPPRRRSCQPRDGALAVHARWRPVELSPENDPDLFYATLGGMGLTGVVVEATLRAEPLPSPWMAADVDRTDGLEQTLELMSGAEHHRYSVAWLDLLADGSKMGRAIVSRADPLASDAATPADRGRRATSGAYPGSLSQRPGFEVPRGFPAAVLRPASMRMFNALRWHASPRCERGRPVAMAPYFFPLDGARRVEPAVWLSRPGPVPVRDPFRRGGRAGALLRADPHAPAARLSRGVQALRSRVRRSALVPARRLDAGDRHPAARPGWEQHWTSSTRSWPAAAAAST